MPNYTVTWEIQVSAKTPREAAEIARSFQRDHSAMVGVFDVIDESGEGVRVDLDDAEEDDEAGQPCSRCGEDSGTRCGALHCPY